MQAISIDGFYGMVNEWCPHPIRRVPSVVDNILIADTVVRDANLSLHLAAPRDVPATRVRLQVRGPPPYQYKRVLEYLSRYGNR